MELPVASQAQEFLTAVVLGVILALWYDVLRGLRRRHRHHDPW